MSDKTSAWADKATLDDIAAHIAANGSSAIGHRLLEIAREQAVEPERLRTALDDDTAMLELAWARYFDPLNGPAEPFTAGRVAMLKACRAVIGTKR
jgi:hypothetical protein